MHSDEFESSHRITNGRKLMKPLGLWMGKSKLGVVF